MKILSKALLLAAIPAALTFSGCAARTDSNGQNARKGRYITLPAETGSRVPRRVWVNDDGTVSDPASSVQKINPEVMGELQRRGNINRGGGN
ncbi:MAG: hypothetical protein FJ398_00370 [Verrucomicrobia bacterium]|nr:hypothetical protein [Verrucomicrobiota bacterium]